MIKITLFAAPFKSNPQSWQTSYSQFLLWVYGKSHIQIYITVHYLSCFSLLTIAATFACHFATHLPSGSFLSTSVLLVFTHASSFLCIGCMDRWTSQPQWHHPLSLSTPLHLNCYRWNQSAFDYSGCKWIRKTLLQSLLRFIKTQPSYK